MAAFGRKATGLAVLALVLALAGCGNETASPSPRASSDQFATSPGPTATDLSAIACATDDPTDVGELTGAWSGSEGGVYYIRQVGDCLWWFGTEIEAIEPGQTGQPGFANVASGRVDDTKVEVEYADLPLGHTLGGGGLTFVYDDENGTLTLTEQRGDWIPFGGSVLTRIEPNASLDASPGESASP